MKKLDLLIAIYIGCISIAELMGGKTFPLMNIAGYQLNASVAIFLIPLIYCINDIVTEIYGKERTRSIIRASLVVICMIIGFSFLATSLPPSVRFASTESAYDTIFGLSARIATASLTAFAIAEFLDVYVYARIRKYLGSHALWFRVNISNITAQFVDTVLFMTLAFYAFDQTLSSNIIFLSGLILPYWLVKCSMSALMTPLVYLGVNWLKNDDDNTRV
jgi:hypothetical protein